MGSLQLSKCRARRQQEPGIEIEQEGERTEADQEGGRWESPLPYPRKIKSVYSLEKTRVEEPAPPSTEMRKNGFPRIKIAGSSGSPIRKLPFPGSGSNGSPHHNRNSKFFV